MPRNKLTRDEHIRLEALTQANITAGPNVTSPDTVIALAKKYEKYIKEGKY